MSSKHFPLLWDVTRKICCSHERRFSSAKGQAPEGASGGAGGVQGSAQGGACRAGAAVDEAEEELPGALGAGHPRHQAEEAPRAGQGPRREEGNRDQSDCDEGRQGESKKALRYESVVLFEV